MFALLAWIGLGAAPAPSPVAVQSVTLQRLGPSDAAVLETFVVPRYLTLFGEAALDMFLSSGAAAIS